MSRADTIAHAVVTVVLITSLTVLGLAGVLTAQSVVTGLFASGGIVGVLTASDRMAYGKDKPGDAECGD